MPRPKSRANPLSPSRMTEAADREVTNLFDLSDAKAVLGIDDEESFRDADLLILIPRAQAIVEKISGIHLSPVQVKVQYENPCNGAAACLEVPESDIIIDDASFPFVVTEYPTEDSDGEVLTEHTIDDPDDPGSDLTIATKVVADKSLGRTYITRTDGCYFPRGRDIVVEVELYRGIDKNSQRGEIAKLAMGYTINELNTVNGATSPAPPQMPAPFVRNPYYQGLMVQLRSNSKIARPLA